MSSEPTPTGLWLIQEYGRSLRVGHAGQELLRYVYQPWDVQWESPKPYFHPLRTLGGDPVSLYRPHDHVWHKGISLSLPNITGPDAILDPAVTDRGAVGDGHGQAGEANFWGGPTFVRPHGYQGLPNNGTQRHRDFTTLDVDADQVRVVERLDWISQAGRRWFDERRSFTVRADRADPHWVLTFSTELTNVTDVELRFGSPTTQGRPEAGYGGLFWRGPRSFSGGRVLAPGVTGGDELMGLRAPWLGFVGLQDSDPRASTLVFADGNPGSPTPWFVRTGIYACLCPAPFFDTEVPLAAGDTLTLRYAIVVADGEHDPTAAAKLAEAGLAVLSQVG